MKTSLQTIHCVLENNPAWPVHPLPWDAGGSPRLCPAVRWETLVTQYQKGEKRFFHLLCCHSKPLVDKISRKRYFVAHLGRDEAYSIAAMSMVEFWAHEALQGDPRDIPRRLTQAMNCDLLNQINRKKTRRQREVHYEAGSDPEDAGEEWQGPLADSSREPEQQALQAEWNRKVRDCLQYLGTREQQVILGFFFRQLSVAEIAQEMHCTPACVSATKRNALCKLREIFRKEQIR